MQVPPEACCCRDTKSVRCWGMSRLYDLLILSASDPSSRWRFHSATNWPGDCHCLQSLWRRRNRFLQVGPYTKRILHSALQSEETLTLTCDHGYNAGARSVQVPSQFLRE